MKTYNERTESIKNKVKVKRNRRAVIWTSAVCACVFAALTVVCSLPILGEGAPNINAYKNDAYYPLISKINEQYSDGKYSIFGKIVEFGDLMFKGASSAEPPAEDEVSNPSDSSSVGDRYEETTLNQVNGVIEGDLLKRSNTHAFYLKNVYDVNSEPCLLLQSFRLAGGDTTAVGELYVRAKDGTSFSQYRSYIEAEMFLNADATRLTVVAPCLSQRKVVYTAIVSLDVSDPSEITEVNRVYVSGAYVSSRLVNGNYLIVTNFNVGSYGYDVVDYDAKETYVPQCGKGLQDSFISIDDIYIPDNCSRMGYTVLAMLDENTLEVKDSYAAFSYTQDVYVSLDYLVVARNSYYYYKNGFDYGNEVAPSKTGSQSLICSQVCEMLAISYKDGFDKKGEIGVDGCIKDRYSMDEKDGILRVFTTVNQSEWVNGYALSSTVNVSLYCVDLKSMQVVASKERFAPSGDEVKSARFDGDKAYVCTARRNTDPVFYFDLSDLNNITFADTGEIEGYSANLVKFNDLLLGIGEGENNGILKVELYAQSDDENAENGVVSVAKYEQNCVFSREYKAHFVNAEHNLIGLQIYGYANGLVTSDPNASRDMYLLLRFDGEKLIPVYSELFDSSLDHVRAFYADNGVYVFGTKDFTFIDLNR